MTALKNVSPCLSLSGRTFPAVHRLLLVMACLGWLAMACPAAAPVEEVAASAAPAGDGAALPVAGKQPATPTDDAGAPPAPLSAGEKMKRAARLAFLSPYSYGVAAVMAGISYRARWADDYGYGTEGYLKRFGNSTVSGYTYDMVGHGLAAVVFRQDPRYHSSGSDRFGARLGHALASVFVTRSDGGRRVFNACTFTGLLAAAGVSTALHPNEDHHDGRKYLKRVGFGYSIQIATRLAREFFRFLRNVE